MSTLTTPFYCVYTALMLFQKLQRFARLMIVLSVSGFTLIFLAVTWFVFGLHNDSRVHALRTAFWMEHAWMNGAKSQEDRSNLLQHVDDQSLTDLYFHVGPISESGQAADDLKIDKVLLRELKNKGVKSYAWLGQIRQSIDLESPAVRQSIVDSSLYLVEQGFEGLHVDIEPVPADDTAFLNLISELKAALPGTALSVAMDEWQPHGLSQWVARWGGVDITSYWSTQQFQEVAAIVDQMVVMTYDTHFKDPALYTWWVEQQTLALSQRLPEGKELFIGLPTYEEGQALDPRAENLRTGLEGVRRGLSNLRSRPAKITGVAVYSYWETQADEWSILSSQIDKP